MQHSDPLLHPHSWVVGNWSRCSRSCDAGVRSRSVVCQRRVSAAEEKALDDSACPQPRPPVLEACQGPMCPPEWAALEWSEVSFHLSPHPTHSQYRRRTGTGLFVWKSCRSNLAPSPTVIVINRGHCGFPGFWTWVWSGPLPMKGGPSLGQVVRLAGNTVSETGLEDSTGTTSYLSIPCVPLASTHPTLNIKHPF